MTLLQEIIINTPWWVYVIFVYMLFIGIKSLWPRTILVYRPFILPSLFLFYSLYYHLVFKFLEVSDILFWILAFILGMRTGWGKTTSMNIKADKKQYLIHIQGNSFTLILVMAIFFTRYTLSFIYAMHPHLKNSLLTWIDWSCSGLFAGILLGYAIGLLQKFKKADHIDLP